MAKKDDDEDWDFEEVSPEEQKKFDEELSAQELAGIRARLEDAPAPGMLPDGTLNIVDPKAPKQGPKVVEEEPDDLSDLDDLEDIADA